MIMVRRLLIVIGLCCFSVIEVGAVRKRLANSTKQTVQSVQKNQKDSSKTSSKREPKKTVEKTVVGRGVSTKRRTLPSTTMTGPYGVVQNSIMNRVPKEPTGRKFLNVMSALVPIALASGGIQQIISGHSKVGAALLAGSAGTSIARAFVIHNQLKKAAEDFDTQMKEFLIEWPVQKENVPLSIQAPLDMMYNQYRATNGQCSGDELVSFAYSLDAWKMLERVREPVPMTEKQKCVFVRKELGDIQRLKLGSLFFLVRFITDAFQINYLNIPFTWTVGLMSYLFPLFFYGPLRRYAYGLKNWENVLIEAQQPQSLVDSKVIQQEWPFKFIEPKLNWLIPEFVKYEEKQPFRLAASVIVSIGLVMIIKSVAGICSSILMRKHLYKAHLLKLDSFMSVWPGIKHQVPFFLHERLDELYGNRLDSKTNKLHLNDKERATILNQINLDIDAFLNQKKLPAVVATKSAEVGVVA